jgi:hypothetical protein
MVWQPHCCGGPLGSEAVQVVQRCRRAQQNGGRRQWGLHERERGVKPECNRNAVTRTLFGAKAACAAARGRLPRREPPPVHRCGCAGHANAGFEAISRRRAARARSVRARKQSGSEHGVRRGVGCDGCRRWAPGLRHGLSLCACRDMVQPRKTRRGHVGWPCQSRQHVTAQGGRQLREPRRGTAQPCTADGSAVPGPAQGGP